MKLYAADFVTTDFRELVRRPEVNAVIVATDEGPGIADIDTAMKLGTALLRMNVFSVLSKTIVVDEILVEAPEITVEGGPSKNNLLAIQDNVMRAVPGSGSPAGGEQKAAAPASPSSIKILIKEFTFKEGRAAAHFDAGPLGTQDLSMGLPDIHLKDIGKETGGATPEQAVSAVLSAVTRAGTLMVSSGSSTTTEALNLASPAHPLMPVSGSKTPAHSVTSLPVPAVVGTVTRSVPRRSTLRAGIHSLPTRRS